MFVAVAYSSIAECEDVLCVENVTQVLRLVDGNRARLAVTGDVRAKDVGESPRSLGLKRLPRVDLNWVTQRVLSHAKGRSSTQTPIIGNTDANGRR
jgi:hypothetical protein